MAQTKITLPYPPINKKFFNNGYMDPEMRTWLISVYNILGGSNASTNSQIKDNINQNSNDIEDVKNNVNINSDNINALDSSVSEIEIDVETLQNESKTNATNILATVKALDTLTLSVQNLNNELQTLENTVNNLKTIELVSTLTPDVKYAQKFVYTQDTSSLYFSINGTTFYKLYPTTP